MRHLMSRFLVFCYLLLYHILSQNLVEEFERFLFYELVVQTLAVCRLNNMCFIVAGVLYTNVRWVLMLLKELLLVLNRVLVMLY